MLYRLLYIPAKLAFWIYCRHLYVNKKQLFKSSGPLLIAANHPDSFLDAIILSTLFKRPVYSLARGDAFTKPLYKRLLYSLNMFPVYRLSEGAENLGNNYDTFAQCKSVFRKNGIVLIFSEGRCINEWKLRPLKKGTARLALSSWEENIPLNILPVGINYSSFTRFGKNIRLNFGDIIQQEDIVLNESSGKTINDFNEMLRLQLEQLVITIKQDDIQLRKKIFFVHQPLVKKILLFIPASIGYLVHAPLYIPIQRFSWKKAHHIDHYDSLIVGLLFLLYPFYLLLLSIIAYSIFGSYWWTLVWVVIPFCARAFVQLKKQV